MKKSTWLELGEEEMPLKYHGLVVRAPDSGQFRFGMNQLIGYCQSWLWSSEPNIPESAKEVLERFHNRAYWQCATKSKDSVHKLNKAVRNLGRCVDIRLGRLLPWSENAVIVAMDHVQTFGPMAGLIDFTAAAERVKETDGVLLVPVIRDADRKERPRAGTSSKNG